MKTKIRQNILITAVLLLPLFIKAQWNHVRFDQYNTFSKVFTVTPDTAFVIGAEPMIGENFIVRTNDGGATWD